jgi:hypothetical protein
MKVFYSSALFIILLAFTVSSGLKKKNTKRTQPVRILNEGENCKPDDADPNVRYVCKGDLVCRLFNSKFMGSPWQCLKPFPPVKILAKEGDICRGEDNVTYVCQEGLECRIFNSKFLLSPWKCLRPLLQ